MSPTIARVQTARRSYRCEGSWRNAACSGLIAAGDRYYREALPPGDTPCWLVAAMCVPCRESDVEAAFERARAKYDVPARRGVEVRWTFRTRNGAGEETFKGVIVAMTDSGGMLVVRTLDERPRWRRLFLHPAERGLEYLWGGEPPIGWTHAGSVSDEDAYNDETQTVDKRKVKVTCPACLRPFAALCSPRTVERENAGGWRWVGCDHQEPWQGYQTMCRCGHTFSFDVYTPQ